MRSVPLRPDAQALAAEAEHLRAGFAALAAQIAARVRRDRAPGAHADASLQASGKPAGASFPGQAPAATTGAERG